VHYQPVYKERAFTVGNTVALRIMRLQKQESTIYAAKAFGTKEN
jgi:hypothetical protein